MGRGRERGKEKKKGREREGDGKGNLPPLKFKSGYATASVIGSPIHTVYFSLMC